MAEQDRQSSLARSASEGKENCPSLARRASMGALPAQVPGLNGLFAKIQ